jgi:hypothetical protein
LQPSFESQFPAWLCFLKAYCQAAVTYVAFDNKGSSTANYRADIEPAYLRKRYKKKIAAGALFDIASLSALPGALSNILALEAKDIDVRALHHSSNPSYSYVVG